MTIYYLYLKTHNITGLKYLGYTGRKDPYKYKGSGDYWSKHINKHNYDVTTEILKECSSKDEIKEWGLYYSYLWNVVEERDEHGNKTWANLKNESGDGGDMSMCENFRKYVATLPDRRRLFRWWNNGINQVFAEAPLDDSYTSGRLPFNNRGAVIGSDKQRGKKWVNNGVHEMMIYRDEFPDGYLPGRLPSPKKNKPNTHAAGSKWWNNGDRSVMARICPGSEWAPGRIFSRRGS